MWHISVHSLTGHVSFSLHNCNDLALAGATCYLDHLHSVTLQARALSIAGSISVDATHNTGNGGCGSVEAHGVGHIGADDHEGLVLVGEQLGGVALARQQAVLPTQLGVDLQHQVAAVLLALAGVRWEPVICNEGIGSL